MTTYTINYFNEKTIGYAGNSVEDAVRYAERFAGNLILHYVGEIVIENEYGAIVASQKWTELEDRSSVPSDWEIGHRRAN